MKAPDAVLELLLKKARAILYASLPERSWFTQQGRVQAALTLPAKWLDERKVELSAERYQAIVEGILNTIKTKGRRDFGSFPCAYLYSCVEAHLRHHGDEYYYEGKDIRNRVKMFMTDLEKARVGQDRTVPILAEVHAALSVGKRKTKIKTVASTLHPDLFGTAKPDQIAKVRAPIGLSRSKRENGPATPSDQKPRP